MWLRSRLCSLRLQDCVHSCFMRMRRWSLARQLFVLQTVVVLAVVLCGAALAYVDTRDRVEDDTGREVNRLAQTVAASPSVLDALDTPRPSDRLQPYAERIRRNTGVDFVTI